MNCQTIERKSPTSFIGELQVEAEKSELELRVNDQVVLPRTNHELFDRQVVKVVLQAGANKVSLKLNNRKSLSWGAWCFACVARLSDGTILRANVDQ